MYRPWSEPLVRENPDKIFRGMALKERRHGDTSRRKSSAPILPSLGVSTREDESDDCFKEPFRFRAWVSVGYDSDKSVGVFEMKMAETWSILKTSSENFLAHACGRVGAGSVQLG